MGANCCSNDSKVEDQMKDYQNKEKTRGQANIDMNASANEEDDHSPRPYQAILVSYILYSLID